MGVTTTTQSADIIEKVVSSITTEVLQQQSVMMGAVEDRSGEVRPGMDRLDVPLYDNLLIQSVSETVGLSPQDITLATAKLNLDQHEGASWAISDRSMTQSKGDMVAETIRNLAFKLAASVDDYLLGLVNAGAASRNALTASPLDDIAEARKILNQNNVPMSERYLLVSPAFEAAILKFNSFIRANEYGSARPIQAGEIGSILGFTVLMSNSASIVEDGFHALHKSSVMFARQIQPKFESDRNVLGVRDEYALTHLYGGIMSGNGNLKSVVFDADGVL